jgi:hypothetical protein
MLKKIMTTLSLVAFTLSAGNALASSDKATYDALIKDSISAQKKASRVGFQWRHIGKFIAKAEKAAKSGKYDKAIEFATTAKFQGEQGYRQYHKQKKAGPLF